MSERQIPELQKTLKEKASLQVIGAGISFPFRFSDHGAIRSVEVSQGLDKIKQSIHLILSTRKGERVNRPTFGCFSGDTEVFVLPGKKIRISELVGKGPVKSLGTVQVPASSREPSSVRWRVTNTAGAISKGIKEIIGLTLSNDEYVKCTPDHLFLSKNYTTYVRADSLKVGDRLGWLDIRDPNFRQRLYSSKKSINTPLGILPTTSTELWIKDIDNTIEPEEVFDLANSDTENFLLASGPIVHNSNLPKLLFEPNDEILLPLLQKETADALRIWEKRIKVTNIQFINPGELSFPIDFTLDPSLANELRILAQDDSAVGIYIQYIVLRTSQPGGYVYPFSKNTARFSYNIPELP